MSSIIPNPKYLRASGFLATLGRTLLALRGWKATFSADVPEKCVVMVYPHTSNWDFPIGLFANWASGFRGNYLGKDSLFKSPLGWFFRATGGIPVDRSNPKGMVGALAARFATSEALRLVIAPEGTRKYTSALKTGFYRIAVEAKVPLLLVTIDFASRTVGDLDRFLPSGDEEADLARIRAVYAKARGEVPENAGAITFRAPP
jgi:1-acyl-sn-glycerol-3-phosphate acyltransferase